MEVMEKRRSEIVSFVNEQGSITSVSYTHLIKYIPTVGIKRKGLYE